MKYKYIGSGEDSPKHIKFMKKVDFELGKVSEVTDKEVLAKLKNHKCFEVVESGKSNRNTKKNTSKAGSGSTVESPNF